MLLLNIIINIFRWLPSSQSYQASYQILIAPNCLKLCSIPRVQQTGDKEDKLGVSASLCLFISDFLDTQLPPEAIIRCQWWLETGCRRRDGHHPDTEKGSSARPLIGQGDWHWPLIGHCSEVDNECLMEGVKTKDALLQQNVTHVFSHLGEHGVVS